MLSERLRTTVVAFGLAVLTGCTTPNVPTDVDTTGMPNPEIALRDSFRQVDAEMASLGTMAPTPTAESAPVMPGELQKVVTFSWQGPLDDGVRKLADSIGYTVTISAPEKAMALPIAINTQPEQVFQVFQQMGEAAGTSATVELDPLHHQVQVIHHV